MTYGSQTTGSYWDTAPPAPNTAQQPPWQPPRPATGAVAWWLGLLGFTLVPYLNTFVAGIAMLFAGLSVRKQSPLAATNGRAAANWGLTTVVLTVILLAGVLDANDGSRSFPVWVPASLYAVLYVAHLVAAVGGGVRAHRGKPVAWPAVPFVRKRR